MSRTRQIFFLCLMAIMLAPLSGCAGLIAYPLYVIKGDSVPANYDKLGGKRIAVICKSASAASGPNSPESLISRQFSQILEERVSNVEIVPVEEVADWIDRNNWNEIDCVEVGRGVDADAVILLAVESFSLKDSPTLFKGRSTVTTKVYDITQDGKVDYQGNTFDFSYPQNGGRHTTELSDAAFQRQFTQVLSHHLAKDFFKYDKSEDYAQDATLIQ